MCGWGEERQTDRQTEASVLALDLLPASPGTAGACVCPMPNSLGASTRPSLPQPQTPHLEEDLKEVLRSEAGIELVGEDDVRPEKQKRKAGVSRGAGARAVGGRGEMQPGRGSGGSW